eukprot:TRINITY_DN15054_c0_g1_i1.p1 TRINITY_DN15054_c0_g1~~TRINITY_DN15054_c0_g1_i1.p1  ORF type:complete len:288 (-),score=45.60 TRINITY_DN15054_c0_g1_i1:176-1039(-)
MNFARSASLRLLSPSSGASFGKLLKIGVGASAVVGTGIFLSQQNASASSDQLQPPHYPWSHGGWWQAFDHASIRRGFQVYKQVCSTCHSVHRIAYRNLVDVAFTEAEAKAFAAEATYMDGPDAEGEMFERSGKLADYLPRPYPNEQAARFSNNGALPPDLSLWVKARDRHEDYIYALLTGYHEPPAGVEIRNGLYYNPYFAGGAIGMTPPLTSNGQVEYDDGTPATISQMAKDVTTFLAWAAEPEADDRKRTGIKTLFILTCIAVPLLYFKRFKWSVVKHRVIAFKD